MKNALVLLAAVGALSGCASKQAFTSTWTDVEMLVDGQADEWNGELTPIKGMTGTSYGIKHDDDALYLCLVTNDEQLQRQIMVRGLIVWVDPKGGGNEYWGLQFPLGFKYDGPPRDRPDATTLRKKSTAALEVIGPGNKQRLKIPNNEMSEVQAKVGMSPAGLIYEARIPMALGDTPPYGPGVKPGTVISVGLITPEADLKAMMAPRGGGQAGRGDHGPLDSGDNGFDRPPPARDMLGDEIKEWAQVEIKQKESS